MYSLRTFSTSVSINSAITLEISGAFLSPLICTPSKSLSFIKPVVPASTFTAPLFTPFEKASKGLSFLSNTPFLIAAALAFIASSTVRGLPFSSNIKFVLKDSSSTVLASRSVLILSSPVISSIRSFMYLGCISLLGIACGIISPVSLSGLP